MYNRNVKTEKKSKENSQRSSYCENKSARVNLLSKQNEPKDF